MKRDPATIATAGETAPAAVLATPSGGPSPAEAPRACPDCGASSGNPQGDGWQCGACSACNPVCSGCNKVVRVTVRRLCVPCHKEADRLVLRVLNPRDAAATDQRAGQVASVTSPAGAPSPAASEGDSGPQAATPVGESRRDCTCDAWYAPPEARRRCAPGCPANVTDQRAGQVASVTSPAGAPSPAEGDGRSGPQAAGAVPLPPAVPVGTGVDDLLAWGASRDPMLALLLECLALVPLDRPTAVRAALALLAPHKPSQAPAGRSFSEALIYNAILSLETALQPEQGEGGT